MKKVVLLFLILGTVFMFLPSRSMAVTVSGSALLEGQSDHSGISVIFHRTTPSEARDTAYTDQSGHYSADILTGIYEITFSKNNFYPQTLKDQVIYEDKTIENVTLVSAGLSGRQKGVIAKGDYIVGDSIWVQNPDTLKIEPGTRLFFRKGTGLTVYGYLDAQGTEQDSIIFTRYLGTNDNPDSTYWNGIYLKSFGYTITNEFNSTIKYCHISWCSIRAINIELCSPDIENTLISDCAGWNAVMTYSSCFRLKNLKFANCSTRDTSGAWGTSCLYLVQTSDNVSVSNIEITGIKSKNMGAVGFFDVNGLNLDNFNIHDNNGYVINNFGSYATFNNATIVNNTYGFGVSNAKVKFNNCIIANNSGPGLWNNVLNSDFYNNTGFDTTNNKWLGVNVTVNKNGDSCDAFGNIQLDPQFNNPALMDYSLRSSSPCIDAGSNDSVRTSSDILGNARIWDGNMDGDSLVDMGCYEYGAPPVPMIDLIDQDFESGLAGWKVINNGGGSETVIWKTGDDQAKAHSGRGYASIKSINYQASSTITSPYVDLPASDHLILSCWLSSGSVSKVKDIADQSQMDSYMEIMIFIQAKNSDEYYIYSSKVINQSWTKHTFDISSFRGREVIVGVKAYINSNGGYPNEILLDDIKLETESGITSVDNEVPPPVASPDGITIYPNPASDYIYIQTGEGMTAPFSIAVYNIMGEKVMDTGITGNNGKIDISSLPSGVYYLSMTNGKESRRERVVVNR